MLDPNGYDKAIKVGPWGMDNIGLGSWDVIDRYEKLVGRMI